MKWVSKLMMSVYPFDLHVVSDFLMNIWLHVGIHIVWSSLISVFSNLLHMEFTGGWWIMIKILCIQTETNESCSLQPKCAIQRNKYKSHSSTEVLRMWEILSNSTCRISNGKEKKCPSINQIIFLKYMGWTLDNLKQPS